MGGEPLLALDLLKELLPWTHRKARAEGKDLRIDMTSNGTLLNEETARFLSRHKVKVLLSLDGDQDSHDRFRKTQKGRGSFALCLEAAKWLKLYQGFVGAKITTMPQTAGNLLEDLRSLYERGVGFFLLGHATGVPWTSEEQDVYVEQLRLLFDWWSSRPEKHRPRIPFFEREMQKEKRAHHRWGCRAGRRGIAVDPQGDFYPCSKMISGTGGWLRLGSLDEGLSQSQLRKKLCGLQPFDRPSCWNCFFQTSCSGGCYAVNALETGDPFQPGPECKMIGRLSLLMRELKHNDLEP
jgi:uncharacterized protein